jgi:RNAse (barnase) inhibitor barstar
MNEYGYKILHDGFDYFICLLKIPKDSIVIALDCKYRTDRVYICDVRRLRDRKSKNIVNHHCFYDNSLIKYEINSYLETDLDTSYEICASGIHYFPITTNIDYVCKYFKKCFIKQIYCQIRKISGK